MQYSLYSFIIEVYESVSILFQQLCTLNNATSTKSTKGCGNNVFYKREKGKSIVNIFSQTNLSHNLLAINALQNLLFCIPKAAVLHGKSVGFAAQNSRFRNAKAQLSLFNNIIFTKS